ncbi:MAG TPA: hypothetical protein VFN56_03415 [Candidatus Saccharimonadales bacterium]|nr:hypothetical protein [Candidatus Saccharimonadales bacterium]
MSERLHPPSDTPLEEVEAGFVVAWGGGGHEQEYVVSLPGLIGVRGDKEIPRSISRDLQAKLQPMEVVNRGSRLEILGERNDDFVLGTIVGYFDELSRLGVQE